jgi:RecA-family ATPase
MPSLEGCKDVDEYLRDGDPARAARLRKAIEDAPIIGATPTPATAKGIAPAAAQRELEPLPYLNCSTLKRLYPQERPEVIGGLLRLGEVMNLISAPKMRKSWLVLFIAYCVGAGRRFFGFEVPVPRRVLILDNELAPETIRFRTEAISYELGLTDAEADMVDFITLRGTEAMSQGWAGLMSLLDRIEPDRYGIIILDALYRFCDGDENDNGARTAMYNDLDRQAQRLRAAFILIHHSSKGDQTGKAVTDVGAGAGAQSRAADVHAILRKHAEEDCLVFDAVNRSLPPVDPIVLRWRYPRFELADGLNPADLKLTGAEERRRQKAQEAEESLASWTAERAAKYLTDKPLNTAALKAMMNRDGLAVNRVSGLLQLAVSEGLAIPEKVGRDIFCRRVDGGDDNQSDTV